MLLLTVLASGVYMLSPGQTAPSPFDGPSSKPLAKCHPQAISVILTQTETTYDGWEIERQTIACGPILRVEEGKRDDHPLHHSESRP